MMDNYFIELAKINVGEHTEKKGNFTYLSWPYAVSELKKAHPEATWEVKHFDHNGFTLPFMRYSEGAFVEVAVTVNGITHSQIHPVLNHQNKPIKEPNPFDVNTAIQRCLAKAIALHGLGLYIYAGEDMPEPPEMPEDLRIAVSEADTIEALTAIYKGLSAESQANYKSAFAARRKEIEG